MSGRNIGLFPYYTNEIKIRLCLILLLIGYSVSVNAQQAEGLFRVNEHDETRFSTDVRIEQLLSAYVGRVIDGDTIVVEIENPPLGLQGRERVRLLGIDAPETMHPTRGEELFGRESTQMAREMLDGRVVYLAFDWDLRDRFGRLLAYVYLSDGVCFNAVHVQNGYARALTRFAFKFLGEFRMYEGEARSASRGLWER